MVTEKYTFWLFWYIQYVEVMEQLKLTAQFFCLALYVLAQSAGAAEYTDSISAKE